MDDGNFDVLIIGTGLTESITAAALSKAGLKVAHVDENAYYGGAEASFTLEELVNWVDIQASGNNPSLRPSLLPSIGPIITSLISSGVSKYGGFRLLEQVGIYQPSGNVKSVPGSKKDVFQSKDISLIDKRRLMRFLMFAASDFEDKKEIDGAKETTFADFLKTTFSLPQDIVSAIVYCLAFSSSIYDPALPALHRIQRYLRSGGRYGPSPFLIGHYGGAGELAQGFCRAAAVSGGVYVLGRKILSITQCPAASPLETPHHYTISLEDFQETLTARIIISSFAHVPAQLRDNFHRVFSVKIDDATHTSTARCIAILDQPILFPTTTTAPLDSDLDQDRSSGTSDLETAVQDWKSVDAGMLIFPPSSVEGGSATTAAAVLVTGEGTMSTPSGKWIVYISLPLSSSFSDATPARELLAPYLQATLALCLPPASQSTSPVPAPVFTTFYIEHCESEPVTPPSSQSTNKTILISPSLSPVSPLPEVLDTAATRAEAIFWEAVRLLKKDSSAQPSDSEDASISAIKTFWPPEDPNNDSDGEDW